MKLVGRSGAVKERFYKVCHTRRAPVSYTHLDVYKRQVPMLPVLSMAHPVIVTVPEVTTAPAAGVSIFTLGGDGAEPSNMSCLLYTSRCV